tara:strand:+ start:283 stop:444 length:162 start_codon:yes stop_codon:yes gene_type:complete
MTKLFPPVEADPSYWKNAAEENYLAFLKSRGFKSIEDFKKRQIKKSRLLPPDW